MSDNSKIIPIGIDLGTTFCAVAYLDSNGRPNSVRNAEGHITTPSVVFFDRSNTIVGQEAAAAGIHEPDRLAQFAKRDMGEEAYEKPIRGERIPSEVVQGLILKKLKEDTELHLGAFDKAVVTVPAFFNEPCRKATMDAGRLAGLEVLDIINEPTAAAIMYGVEQGFLNVRGESLQKELVLVYDLGGGTFDVTLMEIDGSNFTAIASDGDVYLGGVDFDMRIIDFVAEEFETQIGCDLRSDPLAHQEMLQKANQAKHALTAREEVSIFFNYEGQRLRTNLTREKFEFLTQDLIDRTQLTVTMILHENNVSWNDITRVLLVGGSTRIPAIGRMLTELSNMEVDRSLSPDEAVAHGAAIYAGLLLNSNSTAKYGISVTNVNSHDLSVLGAKDASGRRRRQVMIPRNTQLPARNTERFKTARDNQPNVKVAIIEGGDDTGMHATPIGACVVKDLPPNLPAKTPIDVTFEYASNGRLLVSASLPTADRNATMEINRAAGLTEAALQQWQSRMNTGFGDPVEAAAAEVTLTEPPGDQTLELDAETETISDFPTETAPLRTPSVIRSDQKPNQEASNAVPAKAIPVRTVKKLGQPKKHTRPVKKLSKPAVAADDGEAQPKTTRRRPKQKPADEGGDGSSGGGWKSRRKKLSDE